MKALGPLVVAVALITATPAVATNYLRTPPGWQSDLTCTMDEIDNELRGCSLADCGGPKANCDVDWATPPSKPNALDEMMHKIFGHRALHL